MVESDWRRFWEAELEDQQIPEAELAAMRAQPGFHAAMEHSLRGSLRFSDGEPVYHRMMSDTACMLLGVVALYLDATGGLTHRRLREVAGISGVLSAGRVSALLMRMQMIGYVHAAPYLGPPAPKRYWPTAQMTAAFQARYRLDFEAVQMMRPEIGELLDRYDQPEGFRAFMRVYGEALLRMALHPQGRPEPMVVIANRRAGVMVLLALLDAAAAEAGRFPAAGHARVSIAALAKRFRVSRTHVLKILRQAVAAGFFTRGATEGEGEVQPALVEAFERGYASVFIGVAGCAHRALRDQVAVEAA